MKAYLANALFSDADQAYNAFLAYQLRQEFSWLDLYVPQENEALNDKQGYADSVTIFNGDNEYLDKAEILIAVLDGAEIDSGVASEIGRFALNREFDIEYNEGQSNKIIIGVYTDMRQQGRNNLKKLDALKEDATENQFMYRNLYVVGAVKSNGFIVSSINQLIESIDKLYPQVKNN